MAIEYLVTHSGGFHADELLSSAILKFIFPKAKIIRSREKGWIAPSDIKIIYDVGGEYDLNNQIFDHHQRPNPLRIDGQPYSSFGLIWKHFGKDFLKKNSISDEDIEHIYKEFDTKFVLPIDLIDNGEIDLTSSGAIANLSLPTFLENFKPAFDNTSASANDDAFMKALPIAKDFIQSAIQNLSSKHRANKIVTDLINDLGSSEVLELPTGMPFQSALENTNAKHILFIIYPRGSEWTLSTIKISENSFDQRAKLPISWAGLTNKDLEIASGINGALFCHNARFIAIAETHDAILKMAKVAVEIYHKENL